MGTPPKQGQARIRRAWSVFAISTLLEQATLRLGMTLTFPGTARDFLCAVPAFERTSVDRDPAVGEEKKHDRSIKISQRSSRTPGNSYQVDPESPAVYITQSSKPMSLRAQNTPLSDTMARNPPPDPTTAILGTWKNQTNKQNKEK